MASVAVAGCLLLPCLQAQRLSWHPSIALWCGNNEIDLSYEWSNSTVLRSNRNMFVVDYQAVFIDTVRKNIKQVREGFTPPRPPCRSLPGFWQTALHQP